MHISVQVEKVGSRRREAGSEGEIHEKIINFGSHTHTFRALPQYDEIGLGFLCLFSPPLRKTQLSRPDLIQYGFHLLPSFCLNSANQQVQFSCALQRLPVQHEKVFNSSLNNERQQLIGSECRLCVQLKRFLNTKTHWTCVAMRFYVFFFLFPATYFYHQQQRLTRGTSEHDNILSIAFNWNHASSLSMNHRTQLRCDDE